MNSVTYERVALLICCDTKLLDDALMLAPRPEQDRPFGPTNELDN
jgi:hypothetical protein